MVYSCIKYPKNELVLIPITILSLLITINKELAQNRLCQLNKFEDVKATIIRYVLLISKEKPFNDVDHILKAIIKEKMIMDSLNNNLLYPILALSMINELDESNKDTIKMIKGNVDKIPSHLILKIMKLGQHNSFDVFLNHPDNSSYITQIQKLIPCKNEPSLHKICQVVNEIHSKLKISNSKDSEEF